MAPKLIKLHGPRVSEASLAPHGSQRARVPSKRLLDAQQSLASPPATAKRSRKAREGRGGASGGAGGGAGGGEPVVISSRLVSSEEEQEEEDPGSSPPPSNQQNQQSQHQSVATEPLSPTSRSTRGLPPVKDDESAEFDKPPKRPSGAMRPSGDLGAPFLKEMEKAFFDAEERYKESRMTASEEREQEEGIAYEEKRRDERVARLIEKERIQRERWEAYEAREAAAAATDVSKKDHIPLRNKGKGKEGSKKDKKVAQERAEQQAREQSLTNNDPLEAVAFAATFSLRCGNKTVANHTKDYEGPIALGAASVATTWAKGRAKERTLDITRSSLVVQGYLGSKRFNRPYELDDGESDFRGILDSLATKCLNGAQYCTMVFTFESDKAMNSSQLQVPPKGTATEAATARLGEYLVSEHVRGDYGNQIRLQWPCTLPNCRNTGRYCWWRASNIEDNHYPITADALTEWASKIKTGELAPDRIDWDVMHKLQRARERFRGHKAVVIPPPTTSQPTSSTAPVINTHVFLGAQDILRHLQEGALLATATAPTHQPASSPIHIHSPQTDTTPEDQVYDFFVWLKKQPSFINNWQILTEISERLIDEGYELDAVANMSHTEWVGNSLKAGYRARIRRMCRKYRVEKRASPNRSPPFDLLTDLDV